MQLSEYAAWLKDHKRSEHTIRQRKQILSQFNDWYEGDDPSPIDGLEWFEEEIETRFEKDQITSDTMRIYLDAIQDYFHRTMSTRERRQSDFDLFLNTRDDLPPSDYVHHKAEADNIDYFQLDEIERIIEDTNSLKYWLIYRMMFHSGRRPGEVVCLRVGNIDLTGGTITYPVLKKRVSDQIKIKESPETLDKLKNWLKTRNISEGYVFPSSSAEGHLTTRSIRNHLDQKLRGLNIPKNGRSPKSFRHSHVTWRVEDGDSLEHISRTGTKNTVGVLEKVYAGLTVEEQEDATMGADLL